MTELERLAIAYVNAQQEYLAPYPQCLESRKKTRDDAYRNLMHKVDSIGKLVNSMSITGR
jgi:hypothetical protein